jgi:peptide/nickel transport system substrate-binding protein
MRRLFYSISYCRDDGGREVKKVVISYVLAKYPAIPGAYDQLAAGRISRREFLQFATLLGLSAGAAAIAAGCAAPASIVATESSPSAAIRRGGTFTRAMELRIDHPPVFPDQQRMWYAMSLNTDQPATTSPTYLPSGGKQADVKPTLFLKKASSNNMKSDRRGCDVNFEQWLNLDTGRRCSASYRIYRNAGCREGR